MTFSYYLKTVRDLDTLREIVRKHEEASRKLGHARRIKAIQEQTAASNRGADQLPKAS
jgi:hypothetical protein